MYDFTQDQLQSILELQPEGSSHELYREGFVEAQRAIYRKLSGSAAGAIELQEPQSSTASPAAQPREPEPAVGMRLRSRRTGRTDLQIVRVEHTQIVVGASGSDGVWVMPRSSFWSDVELLDAAPALVAASLAVADELAQISKIIDELTVGYGNSVQGSERAWNSKLFAALSARRKELRQMLVSLG